MNSRRRILQWLAALPVGAWGAADAPVDPIEAAIRRIKPLFKPKTPAQPGDWLLQHPEPGQTYAQYRALVPTRAADRYSTLRIVPIGPLSAGQLTVFEIVKDFLGPFFGLELVMSPPVDLTEIPEAARNQQTMDGSPQLLTTYLLQKVLLSRRMDRDAAVLGLTAFDLWPGPGWNFVFGQSSLTERVGVWSMARNGDADGSPRARTLCALRTAMTATHETGHMFGIRHCIAYQCGMNGSNNSDERDRQPLEFCPECQPKLWWTCGLDPLKRSDALVRAARKHGFDRLAGNLQAQSTALRSG